MAGTEENPIVYPRLDMPDNVEREKITINCLGIALDGDLYRPKQLDSLTQLPGVVLSHGIGGDKFTCERYAAKFAAEGMISISFSQASWGESQGRVRLVDKSLSRSDFTSAEGREARIQIAQNIIDPLDWIDCYLSAIDYLSGEQNVDESRIGAWGTSYGGGTAVCAAAIDERIKALSIQVPAVFNPVADMVKLGRVRAVEIARGQVDSLPMGLDALPGLEGTPHFARMAYYKVGDMVHQVEVPTLIIDAGDEAMFDITESGGRAFKILQERGVDTYYEVIPGIDHYGIYFKGYERGSQLALEWFQKYL